MSPLAVELRVALRRLRHEPATGVAVVCVLALGLGAVLLVSSAVDGLLLRPLPYPDPDRLLELHGAVGETGAGGVSLLEFGDLRDGVPAAAAMAAYRRRSFLMSPAGGRGQARVVQTALATAGVPATLGVAPRAGRDFDAAEERAGAAVALLGWSVADELFADPLRAPGGSVLLNDVAHTIVGVMPPGFELWVDGHVVDALVPIDPALYGTSRDVRSLHVLARLAPDASRERLAEQLTVVADRLAREHPDTNRERGFAAVSLHEALRGDNRTPLGLLGLAAGLLLVASVVNAGSLLLERALGRASEIGVRLVLGAGAGTVAMQFVVEAGVLTAIAAGAAWGMAVAGLRLLPAFLEAAGGSPGVLVMQALEPRLGPVPLAVAGGLAAATALALGLGLAGVARRSAPLAWIRLGAGARAANRTRRVLVVGQVALSVTLLLAASLLAFAFTELVSTDPGFRVDGVARFGLGIPQAGYPDEEAQVRFHRLLEERLLQIPGIEAAGIVAALPVGGGFGTWYLPEGLDLPRDERPGTGINVASPGALQTLELPLLRGRLPTWRDTPATPRVAVIDETLAAAWAGGGDPVGRRIRIGWRSDIHPAGSEWEVIGVVGAIRNRGLGQPPGPTIWLSASQYPLDGGDYLLAVRDGTPIPAAAIAAAVHEIDPGLERVGADSLRARLAQSVGSERTAVALAGGFAAIALLLTCVGVYGLVAVDAARRGREMAIRKAVGASGGAVARLLVAAALRVAVAGIALGAAAFVPVSGLVRARIPGTDAGDPGAMTSALAAIVLVCIAAAVPPAIRAARRSPARVMRDS